MPKQVKTNFFFKLYLDTVSSIALIPAIILMVFFGLSVFLLNVDQVSPGFLIPEAASMKNVISPDSARTLLNTIATGIITLMIFSFTMVMVVLNQTASNYSPRVLSTLLRRRFHQIIMGIYLGTIAYTFLVLSCIQSEAFKFDVPILSLAVNAFLGLVCLVLFIIFIQSISLDIQIGNIINKIYTETIESINYEKSTIERLPEHQLPNTGQWELLKSPVSGYLDGINERDLQKITKKFDITIRMQMAIGKFVNQGDAFFYVSRKLSEREHEDVFRAFVFRHQELVKQNYLYGFKQLTEIAVKALSPGINDPGTAIQAIDRLTDLFVKRMELKGLHILVDKEKQVRFIYQPVSLEEIFYFSFSSIKNYAGKSVPVMLKLLIMIKTLFRNDREGELSALLSASVIDTIEQFVPDLQSESDKKRFMQALAEFEGEYLNHPRVKKAIKYLSGVEEQPF